MPCVSALYVCLICVPYMCALYVKVAELFGSQTFRVFTSRDVVGVEIGGAVKNVIAIAAGIFFFVFLLFCGSLLVHLLAYVCMCV